MRRQLDEVQEGAVAVVVAICLLLLFGAGAVAIDLGAGWETKRELVADTDAAALAGAQALAAGDCSDAESVAEDFLEINTGVTSIDLSPGVDFDCDASAGTVRVDYTGQAQQTLSGAIGQDELDVFSSSTARTTDGTPGGGLRPFSVCMTDPAVGAWVAGGAGTVLRLDIEKTWHKDADDNCGGGAPGNWGYLCYQKGEHNAGSCNANTITELVLNGYDGSVDLETSDPSDGDCFPETPAGEAREDCDPITGSTNAGHYRDALTAITCDASSTPDAADCPVQFAILGVDSFTGSGSNAKIHPTHFLGVVLRGWHIHGSTGHLDVELVNLFDDGTSAVLDHGTLAEPVTALCGADHVTSVCGG